MNDINIHNVIRLNDMSLELTATKTECEQLSAELSSRTAECQRSAEVAAELRLEVRHHL